jgi:hypothetical protein
MSSEKRHDDLLDTLYDICGVKRMPRDSFGNPEAGLSDEDIFRPCRFVLNDGDICGLPFCDHAEDLDGHEFVEGDDE